MASISQAFVALNFIFFFFGGCLWILQAVSYITLTKIKRPNEMVYNIYFFHTNHKSCNVSCFTSGSNVVSNGLAFLTMFVILFYMVWIKTLSTAYRKWRITDTSHCVFWYCDDPCFTFRYAPVVNIVYYKSPHELLHCLGLQLLEILFVIYVSTRVWFI